MIEPLDVRNMIKSPPVPIQLNRMNNIGEGKLNKNPFDDNEDLEKISQITAAADDKTISGGGVGGGRVKKFFRELKDISCQNIDPHEIIDDRKYINNIIFIESSEVINLTIY